MVDPNLHLLSLDELVSQLVETERAARIANDAVLQLIGEMDRRGVAAELGHKDLPQVLKHLLRWDPRYAKPKVERARLLTPQITPSGAQIEPALPATAEALAEGALSEEHVDAIAGALKDLPAGVPADEVAVIERYLADVGREYEPRVTRVRGKELIYSRHQNDREPDHTEPPPPSDKLVAKWERGRLRGWFDLGLETGAKLEAALDPLSKPRPSDSPEGPETRTLAERQGDAFAELVNLMLRADVMPSHGGETVTMAVTLSFEELRKQVGAAILDNQQHMTAKQVRKLACEAGIIPLVLGSRSQPLNIGRKTRALNAGIRRALVARDRGCAFPGCDRPPRHCEGHHVHHWSEGGKTSVRNCVLLCRRHHDLIHHSDWEVKIDNGIPYFIPPAFLDPLRRPRRNPLHMVS